ncbi:MAG: ABC transporter ATP-binding protein [Peptococcaceae bacterium]|jgi:ABC-2 type transport system ATP-binding protein|nr:ABC transporter ATP-binding protein [Peptococcaceae bacterium]MBQ2119959.1 ABC transporter ATP-binding protein [Peptococcaceae bacterium]MBQ2449218.1 ABC transporter ATP-binding protein [Peptococcaceae bacterium]MBQ5653008.1 ABC transporter ATP-binding protein [Peptococcaceae bacterium]MBQ5682791.1 ABC transporter ATP-binding protein [Peptococcaceae bacterium]
MTALVQFNHVTKQYGDKKALDDISFTLEPGKIYGLLGPNGSGKSTAIKIINDLLKPTSGTVQINGLAPGVESKKIISYLPDRSYLNDWMKVEDAFKLFEDFYEDFDRNRAEEMLKSLNIASDARLKTLSKGTLEKVQLILIMARRAKLYILDEPIAGVDPAAREYILQTILSNYGEESSILISTHLITDIEKVLDEVLFLQNGRIVLSGAVDDIRAEHGKSIDGLFREVFRC